MGASAESVSAEAFEALRGEPIVRYVNRPSDVPCNETSDAARLCRHPLVSVVMTAYRHEKFIAQAIEGVLCQQADFEYELLLCEDCSPDRTREICLDFQRRYPDRVRVLWSESNVYGAAGGNEQRGEAHCRGEWVAYCEGDDYWTDPLKLQKQVEALRRHPTAGMCFGGTDYLFADSGAVRAFAPSSSPQGGFMSGGEFIGRFLLDCGGGIAGQAIHTSTTVVRRSVLDESFARFPEINGWHLRMRDWTRILAVAALADVCFVPETLSVYRLNNGTGMSDRDGDRLVIDDALCRIYFFLRYYGCDWQTALAACGRRLALQWLRVAASSDADAQRAMARHAAGLPAWDAFLRSFWYGRFYAALRKGAVTRRMVPLFRLLIVHGGRLAQRRAIGRVRADAGRMRRDAEVGLSRCPDPAAGAPLRIVLASDDSGYLPLKTAICSILENVDLRRPYELVVLEGEGGLSAGHKAEVEELVRGKMLVRFVDVGGFLERHGEAFRAVNPRRTIMIWARVFLGELFPDVDANVVYLDTDVLVAGDLGELFATPLGDALIGMVPEAARCDRSWTFRRTCLPAELETYCNSGVLLLNPARWRQEGLAQAAVDWCRKWCDSIVCPDQDALNALCFRRTLLLPPRWNYHDGWVERAWRLPLAGRGWCGNRPEDVFRAVLDPTVLHFWGRKKPWRFNHRPERLRYERAMRRSGWLTGRLEGSTPLRRLSLCFWDCIHGLMKRVIRMRFRRVKGAADVR